AQFHLGPHYIGMVLANQLHPEPVTAGTADATQDRHRLIDVADDEIGAAVVVQIAEAYAARRMECSLIAADLPAHVGEFAADVAKQQRRLLATDAATRMVTADVTVGDEHILPAVQIHIEESRAPTHVFLAHAGEAVRQCSEPE